MTDAEVLSRIKNGLGITGDFQNATLQVYCDEVKAFMLKAGVPADVIQSEAAVGCIMRGVADLWNYGSGNATLSEYFRMRLIQLKAIKTESAAEEKAVKKILPYFFKAEFENYNYDDGAAFFEKYKPQIGFCSTVSKGNLFGRNYDWLYDEKCTVVIRTPAKNGRHGTLGVAAAPSDITQSILESGKKPESFEIIPFLTLDGINDAGVVCEINVTATGDKGVTAGTNPDGEDLFAAMIPRYVLDYASSVDDAIQLLQARNIFCAYSEAMKQEFHFMIADGTKTVVVEFINNEMNVIEEFIDEKPIMTNFYLSGYDGTKQSLTPYAMGTERFEILQEGFDDVISENDMFELMKNVEYSQTYKAQPDGSHWLSEYVGNWQKYGNLTKDSPPEAFAKIISDYKQIFEARQRDGRTWQTVHAAVYNIQKRKLLVSPQESGLRYTFTL